jgi:anti-anti-sigma factor
MGDLMNIAVRQESDIFVVTPEGQLRHDTVCELRDALRLIIHKHQPRCIIICLEKIDAVDVSGFGLLMAAKVSLEKVSGSLRLCSVPKRIKKDLDAINITDHFSIFPDEATAAV